MKKVILIMSLVMFLFSNSNVFSQKKNTSKEKKDEKILVYPDLYKNYIKSQTNLDKGEHFTLNLVVGVFTGGLFGYAGSYSLYHEPETDLDKEENENNQLLFASIFGIVGGVTGALLTWIEISNNIQFKYGKSLLNYTWYGTLGGGIIGALAGMIPYSQDANKDHIYNYMGYGAMGGMLAGALLYVWDTFITESENTTVSIDSYFEKRNTIVMLTFTHKL